MLIATLVAMLVSLGVFGTWLWCATPVTERRWMSLCLMATLPTCWVMFHGVRMPLDGWLVTLLGDGEALGWLRTAYAPLTEEPAKLWPLLLPRVRKSITRENIVQVALALGLGFALGEMVTVAGLIAERKPEIAALPWYQLGGFIQERFMTCAIHSGMTAIVLAAWRCGPGFRWGFASATLAHYCANFPIRMAHLGWLGADKNIAQLLVALWVVGCFTIALAWLIGLGGWNSRLGVIFYGHAICPSCHQPYGRGLFTGFNFGMNLRYERCPLCRKWHWTRRTIAPSKNAVVP